ncbi:MAG: family 16 glycosylhydrolase [Ferruginibacter sp.]|nr:family 16 glycosylhydrolase [Ferruginibacter sp.]
MRKNLLFVFFFSLITIYLHPAHSQEQNKKLRQPGQQTKGTDTIISNSFSDYTNFHKYWNYLYPWGADHNGSARMYGDSGNHANISLVDGNILKISARSIITDEGKSSSDPHLKIKYHSGAIHAKHQVMVSDKFPRYEISGSFKAPVIKGTWPAFWVTAVNGWPPEADILEFKGDNINWQNTFITPRNVETIKIAQPDAATNWHQYKAVLKKLSASDIAIEYYIDEKLTGTHKADFMNKPMWIIINLQMEGSSDSPGPAGTTDYYSKDILITRSRNNIE